MEQDISGVPERFAVEKKDFLQACLCLRELTRWLVAEDKRDAHLYNASACDYLHLVGYTVYAWLWLKMMVNNTNNTNSHHEVARFYFARLLPQVYALDKAIRSGSDPIMGMPIEYF
jgi:hypothetical protein